MTQLPPVASRPKVRRGFRLAAIVIVIILLPFAAHGLWDFVEMRRLVREIEAIRLKGEPVTDQEAGRTFSGNTDEHRRASRYYLAAAMLALESNPGPTEATELREWLSGTTPLRTSRRDIAERLKIFLEKEKDALALVDTANQLAFRGFSPGTEYNYRAEGLWRLSQVLATRTIYLSLAGRPDEAAQSAAGSLTLRRVLRRPLGFFRASHEIPAILSLSSPSRETLDTLQGVLEAEEAIHRPEEDIAAQRALAIETMWRRYYGVDPRAPRNYSFPMRGFFEWAMRPVFTHEFVEALRGSAELLAAAREPWPGKIKATADVVSRHPVDARAKPGMWPDRNMLIHSYIWISSQGVDSTALIIDRCSRGAIALERFRRDHAGALPQSLRDLVPKYLSTVPMDPVTGRDILYRQSPGAYVIYSVGLDEKDDGGDLSSELQEVIKRGWGRRVIAGRDVGIRVLLH